MNISSITSNGAAEPFGGVDPTGFQQRMEQGMAPVAQLFSTTPDQLMDAVRASGGSLSDYAASKGVSNTDLVAAIKQGLQTSAPNGSQLSDTQLTNIANRIANHKPHGHHHHGGAAAAPTGVDGANGDPTAIKSDVEKLMADLKAAGATSPTDPTAVDPAATNSVSTNALLDLLTRFDQQL